MTGVQTCALPISTPTAIELACERGIDLTALRGTGPGGKISKEDVLAAQAAPARPAAARERRVELTAMRRIVAERMAKSKREAPHFYLTMEMDMTAARVRQMRMAAIRPASLDAPIGDDDSNNFSDVVEDENATSPYGNLEDKTVTDMLQDMVKHLDTREATILRYRFGLDGGQEKTLEEVGVKFGVTRERVRQIQNLALRKLRKMIEKLESTKKKED